MFLWYTILLTQVNMDTCGSDDVSVFKVNTDSQMWTTAAIIDASPSVNGSDSGYITDSNEGNHVMPIIPTVVRNIDNDPNMLFDLPYDYFYAKLISICYVYDLYTLLFI